MHKRKKVFPACALYLFYSAFLAIASAAVVSTAQYDNYRSGTNASETILNLSNVNSTTFGRLGAYAVDGQVFAQPLYIPALNVNGQSTNVVFIATMHNSVYAFDASKIGSAPLWQTTLGPSVPVQYAGNCPSSWLGGPESGIFSTPVIDTQAGILYAVYSTATGSNTYGFYIAALDILTGKQKTGSPNLITASVPGIGYDNVGGIITFNAVQQNQRTALTLANGNVYAGFASCYNDTDPYHGWIIGYSASNVLIKTSVFNTTPNGGEGGVWQSGRGLAADSAGNLYAETGNGTNDATDVSESVVVQLGSTGQKSGVYTDPDVALLNQYDLDLGSAGPLYIASLKLLLAGGKEGIIHVLNPAEIDGTGNPAVQSFVATQPCGTPTYNGCFQIHDIVYWDNPTNPLLYVWGANDVLRAWRYSGGVFNTLPDSVGTMSPQSTASALAVSSNANDPATAVLWAVTMDGYLHAYQATNVAHQIYSSGQNAVRDTLGDGTRYIEPTVADGRVYVATQDKIVQVYGLLSSRNATSATAAFLKADTATQGNWRAVYGADGYSIEADQSLNPAYAAPVISGASTFTWAASTTDVRALQKASNPLDRIAATWYSGTSFTIDSGISDQAPHQVALYCLDWESGGRREVVDVLDNDGNIVDSETADSFANGVYMVWNVTGHIVFRVTTTGKLNAVASGILFGGPLSQGITGSAKFVKADAGTQGNWRTVYGADGYSIEADQSLNSAYAAPVISGASTFTWAASTSDGRALQKVSNPSDRIAATWYSTTSFSIDTNISDTQQHQVALYCLDWDSLGRKQTIQVLDSSGNLLDTENMASFNNGTYMVWNVTGHVIFRLTSTGTANTVFSGIFFGGPLSQVTAAATFVKTDTTSQGNWRAVYGADGYSIEADQSLSPAYAAPVISGASTFTWAASTTDVRALQKASNPVDRIAATWYSGTSFTIDSGISDQAPHQVALYSLDWEAGGRQETIQVLDTNGNVIDTRNVAAFGGGVYMVWNVTGHVLFRVTLAGGKNAVASGIFFGGPSSQGTTGSAKFVKADAGTQGNWRTVYGADGYSIEADQSLNSAYAAPVISGASTFTWAASTSDGRALQKVSNPSDRIAATWYSTTSFSIDTNISDTQQHQVALYCLDWDSLGRKQTIQVLDSSGNLLDTENMASFNNGTYMVWNVTGHVIFRLTSTGTANTVFSGIFFGGPLSQVTAAATFVKTDTTSQGNWRAVYGADGYSIEADQSLSPAYAAPVISGASTFTWAASTTDVRALQKASNPVDRIAATWYSGTSFTIDSGISDQAPHQVALYSLDWEAGGRQETIQVLDTNGNVIDTRNVAAFGGGVYMVWNVTGHVLFRVTLAGGKNAVASGIFFGQ